MKILKFFSNSHKVIEGSTPMMTKGILVPHMREK